MNVFGRNWMATKKNYTAKQESFLQSHKKVKGKKVWGSSLNCFMKYRLDISFNKTN